MYEINQSRFEVVRGIWSGLAVAALCALGCAGESSECEALFVQEGRAMAFDGAQLTLMAASPDLVFFCDRPERTAGHLTWDAFMGLVSEGENSFAENSPNAAVSIIGDDGAVNEVVVTLTGMPTRRGNDIVFPLNVLEGELPKLGGVTLLFIDPIGRPLSPGSVAGVHRRHRRRAIRRLN
jgi:hypothetical protein